jgi:hypothetical protein
MSIYLHSYNLHARVKVTDVLDMALCGKGNGDLDGLDDGSADLGDPPGGGGRRDGMWPSRFVHNRGRGEVGSGR